MAMTGVSLKNRIKAKMAAAGLTLTAEAEAQWLKVAEAVVEEIQGNAIVSSNGSTAPNLITTGVNMSTVTVTGTIV